MSVSAIGREREREREERERVSESEREREKERESLCGHGIQASKLKMLLLQMSGDREDRLKETERA